MHVDITHCNPFIWLWRRKLPARRATVTAPRWHFQPCATLGDAARQSQVSSAAARPFDRTSAQTSVREMNDTPPAPLLQPPPTRFSAFPSGSRALDASQSARHATLRRLWDLLHVLLARSSCSDAPSSSHRENASRLLRTWRLLASAREIDLVALWSRAPAVIDAVQLTDADASSDDEAEGERRAAAAAKKAEWLRLGVRRTRSREWPEALLLEYALELVVANELREASEILERYVPLLFTIIASPALGSCNLSFRAQRDECLASQPLCASAVARRQRRALCRTKSFARPRRGRPDWRWRRATGWRSCSPSQASQKDASCRLGQRLVGSEVLCPRCPPRAQSWRHRRRGNALGQARGHPSLFTLDETLKLNRMCRCVMAAMQITMPRAICQTSMSRMRLSNSNAKARSPRALDHLLFSSACVSVSSSFREQLTTASLEAPLGSDAATTPSHMEGDVDGEGSSKGVYQECTQLIRCAHANNNCNPRASHTGRKLVAHLAVESLHQTAGATFTVQWSLCIYCALRREEC